MKLGRDNLALKLCQQIRDEAHRFAQNRFREAYTKAREGLAFTRDQRGSPG